MKKVIVLIAMMVLLTSIISGCNVHSTITLPNNGNTASAPAKKAYTLLLYENALSGLDDTFTEKLSERILANERVQDNNEVQNRTMNFFGSTYVFKYDETLKNKRWKNNRLDYLAKDDETGALCLASFDSETGSLMYYANSLAGKNRAYQSEVNDMSSEEAFLAYAKKLVSQHCSVEGCQVEITSEIFEYDEKSGNYYPRRHVDGYVNNTENVSDFYAVYHFTFYKTIAGIRRYDTNVIEINNTGEVHRLWFDMQDELYADFMGVDINMEQAKMLTEEALAMFIPIDSSVEIIPSLLATNDGVLWLHLNVYVEFSGGTSGYTYVIQVAGTNEV